MATTCSHLSETTLASRRDQYGAALSTNTGERSQYTSYYGRPLTTRLCSSSSSVPSSGTVSTCGTLDTEISGSSSYARPDSVCRHTCLCGTYQTSTVNRSSTYGALTTSPPSLSVAATDPTLPSASYSRSTAPLATGDSLTTPDRPTLRKGTTAFSDASNISRPSDSHVPGAFPTELSEEIAKSTTYTPPRPPTYWKHYGRGHTLGPAPPSTFSVPPSSIATLTTDRGDNTLAPTGQASYELPRRSILKKTAINYAAAYARISTIAESLFARWRAEHMPSTAQTCQAESRFRPRRTIDRILDPSYSSADSAAHYSIPTALRKVQWKQGPLGSSIASVPEPCGDTSRGGGEGTRALSTQTSEAVSDNDSDSYEEEFVDALEYYNPAATDGQNVGNVAASLTQDSARSEGSAPPTTIGTVTDASVSVRALEATDGSSTRSLSPAEVENIRRARLRIMDPSHAEESAAPLSTGPQTVRDQRAKWLATLQQK